MSLLRSHRRIIISLHFILGTLRLASSLNVVDLSPTQSASASASLTSPTPPSASASASMTPKIIKISEEIWRTAASKHSHRIQSLLKSGLTSADNPINAGRQRNIKRGLPVDDWTSLDPINPIYNFLIEYYSLKGAKGPRRLARWAPDPEILSGVGIDIDPDIGADGKEQGQSQSTILCSADEIYKAAMEASHGLGGILLENANLDDLGGTLHLRGSVPVTVDGTSVDGSDYMMQLQSTSSTSSDVNFPELHGVLYNPAVFYNRHIPIEHRDSEWKKKTLRSLAPFQWYSSILRTTSDSDPILHCYGLHEWAMQYHPEGAPPPPSAKYQSGLPLRVPREVINETVERKGIRCTHVDALRFFAPAAGPLNHHGASLERMDQLRLEQKGCVHAHMDLLKIGLKLQPFVDAELMGDILEVALAARKLDVEASPYDATAFGAGIVPVETNEGRKMYRDEQILLMKRAEPVRKRLLGAYDTFMKLAFDEDLLLVDGVSSPKNKSSTTVDSMSDDGPYVAPERIARAEPGGLPWRKNLIEK